MSSLHISLVVLIIGFFAVIFIDWIAGHKDNEKDQKP